MSQQTSEESTQVKLDVTRIAAEICGYIPKEEPSSIEGFVEIETTDGGLRRFSLERGHSREKVLLILMTKHHCYPKPTANGFAFYTLVQGRLTDLDLPYIDALSSAIQAVGSK